MSLTYGFYNSQNGDRVYSTSQLSDFLDGLITDGVFAPISDGEETHHGLKVVALPTPAMAVHVSVGKAWFNGTWTYIDSAYQVNLTQASLVLNRIDAIVLTINKTRASRSNYIEVISGTETSGTPEKPVVQGDTDIYRYVLAWVTVNANTQAITDSVIEDNIGTESGIPFVDLESPLGGNYPSTEALLLQYKTEFDEWFNHMKDQLDTDAAGHLQAEIDDINSDIATRDDNLAEGYDSTSTYENGDFSMDDGVLKKFNGTIWVPKNVTDEIKDMKSTFQDGVNAIYNAEVVQNVSGVPAALTPTALADGVGAIATAKYNAGIEYAQSFYWAHEVSINASASNIFGDYDKNVTAVSVISGNLSNIMNIKTNSYIDNDILTITFTKNGETIINYTNVGRNVNVSLPQNDFDKVSFRAVKKPGAASSCYISAGVIIYYVGKVLRNGNPPYPIINS